jgi:hypothetical protein
MIMAFVIATGVDTLGTARFVMVLVATSPTAILTIFAPAIAPDCVGYDIESFHRGLWIVARDDQFAALGVLFRRLVANQDAQARARH